MAINFSDIKLTTGIFYAVGTVIALFLISSGVSAFKTWSKTKHWTNISKRKRAERDQKLKDIVLPKISITDSLRERILNSDATGLLEMLKNREVTSEEILIVYFQRASTIGFEHGLLTEINFAEALVRARECDKLRRENPVACKGVLFGLPMTVKDSFLLKGFDNSLGMACRCYQPAQDDGLLVKILKGEGAIIYAKSNVPQVGMSNDSNNHVWGQAKNPWDKERSCGGSTGGEGGLLAARCTPLGLGNDIGGSIRIPAICCGVVGFKPGSERVTRAGTMKMYNTIDGLLNLRIATGPLAKSVRDCSLMMKALLNSDVHNTVKLTERDPYYIRREWNDLSILTRPKNLRIGYFKSVEFFAASQANQRAVEEAARHLKNLGYDLVEVEFPNVDDIHMFFLETLGAEGHSAFLKDALQGEKSIADYDTVKIVTGIPSWIKPVLRALMNSLGEKRAAALMNRVNKKSAYEFLHMVARQNTAIEKFFKVWEEKKLDALLSPSFAYPAQKSIHTKDVNFGACYTYLFNILNLPTGALPVTVVQRGEDSYPRGLTPHHDMIYKATAATMEGSVGMPVSVQISTLPNDDERCIGIMMDLENEAQFRSKHAYPV